MNNVENNIRPIRILHTMCRIYCGGVEQLRVLLSHNLPKDNYEHLIITQEINGELPQILIEEGWNIKVIGLAKNIYDLDWYRRAYLIAREFNPDIIHGAVFEGVALANVLGVMLPNAIVISEETSDPTDRRWTGNLLMRALCMRSNKVIGVSPSVVKYLHQVAKIPKNKIILVNNAVAEPPLVSIKNLEQIKEKLGFDEDDYIIGSVGRLHDDHKRISDLIICLKILNDRGFKKIKLLIVGDGADLNMLKNLVANLNLQSNVVFTGYQARVRDYYPLMNVFTLASAREAFGLVLVEAMLANIPVIATKVGGIPYVLDQGKAGILVNPNSPNEFAEQVLRLYHDRIYSAQLAERGRLYAELNFAAKRYCSEIDNLYRTLALE